MGALTLLPIGSEQLCSWSHIGVSHPCPTGERKTLWLPRPRHVGQHALRSEASPFSTDVDSRVGCPGVLTWAP